MKKKENLFIKLNLEKNTDSGEIMLNIQFDNNAPNFTKEKDFTTWNPTTEEWAFANEAFALINRGQDTTATKKPTLEQTDEDEDFVPTANEHEIVDKYLEKTNK